MEDAALSALGVFFTQTPSLSGLSAEDGGQ
jgi:hypothetical protein